jgi:FMN phosphatase YigB (HAD superfamily)
MSEPGQQLRVRAVLFDLDGTLYHQLPVRARMAAELALAALRAPRRGTRTARALRSFRHLREGLRALGHARESLERLQYEAPARRVGLEPDELARLVEEWMVRRPLPHVAAAARRDLASTLAALERRRVEIGVYSDYPTGRKLEALACRARFSLELCSTDPEVNAFKPHPRGFLRACEVWGIEPRQVLYVGDRAGLDAAGARAAGMRCALVGRERASGVPTFATLAELVAAWEASLGR